MVHTQLELIINVYYVEGDVNPEDIKLAITQQAQDHLGQMTK